MNDGRVDPAIAFVGTYPPRRCGIATFTRDVSTATRAASEGVLPMITHPLLHAGPLPCTQLRAHL